MNRIVSRPFLPMRRTRDGRIDTGLEESLLLPGASCRIIRVVSNLAPTITRGTLHRGSRATDAPGRAGAADRSRRARDPPPVAPQPAPAGRALVLPRRLRPDRLLLREADGRRTPSPHRPPNRFVAARGRGDPPRQPRPRGHRRARNPEPDDRRTRHRARRGDAAAQRRPPVRRPALGGSSRGEPRHDSGVRITPRAASRRAARGKRHRHHRRARRRALAGERVLADRGRRPLRRGRRSSRSARSIPSSSTPSCRSREAVGWTSSRSRSTRSTTSAAAAASSRSPARREPFRGLLIGGAPFGETVLMWWNFVARTTEEIVAAREDWQAGRRFGEVRAYAGPRVPLRRSSRVLSHADGGRATLRRLHFDPTRPDNMQPGGCL